MTATVIIPTTGHHYLADALSSIASQTYKTKAYVVVDGQENASAAHKVMREFSKDVAELAILPVNVGANGFYGHRIYAAFTHLVNSEYVLYLDQDNWFDNDHVASCVTKIEQNNLDWCHSYRKIYEGTSLICEDNCESLGKILSYHGVNHVDTSAYCLKTSVAIRAAGAWHGGWGQDRVFLATMAQHFPAWDATGIHSLNYRLGGNQGSVTKEFFLNGNRDQLAKYQGALPWKS